MPRIGMRIIKSAVAVFICFLIYLIRGTGMPFYSAIAAILCMQQGVESTKKVGLNRTIGTLIGGAFGVVVLLLERRFIPEAMPWLRYLLLSVAIIPLIYTTILLEQKTASYISCVVFLSIAVNHGSDVVPYAFAINRVIDTLIGIFVALGVNAMRLPKKRNTKILFASTLTNTLMDSKNQISAYTKVKLKEMIEEGALLTLVTDKTPETVAHIVSSMDIRLPIITMNGAAIYNFSEKGYVYYKGINHEIAQRILNICDELSINTFIHTIINDVMHIYYGDFTNEEEKRFYNLEKVLPLKNYIYSKLPQGIDVICFMVINKIDKIEILYNRLKGCSDAENIKVIYEKYNEDYFILKVYSSKTSRGSALVKLREMIESEKVVVFAGVKEDSSMLEVADEGYVVENAPNKVKENATQIIGDSESDSVVKTIKKIFYSKVITK
ncbi:HAD hydrolase family protein [Clostridium sp.]|uniref:HAD hydrolase family protein n=1 Tax=Clostridium sp. TaxID=1506 RepID=UPI0032175F30